MVKPISQIYLLPVRKHLTSFSNSVDISVIMLSLLVLIPRKKERALGSETLLGVHCLVTDGLCQILCFALGPRSIVFFNVSWRLEEERRLSRSSE